MILAISASVAYIVVACLFLRFVLGARSRLLGSKMGRRHPERLVSPLWIDVVICAFWPLQIIGLFIYVVRDNW